MLTSEDACAPNAIINGEVLVSVPDDLRPKPDNGLPGVVPARDGPAAKVNCIELELAKDSDTEQGGAGVNVVLLAER
ncbi:hypothetical protein HDV00_005284 [Rhizophlyctis rosea]|nr:hypothetical protein HDV00_005284 [Rhizophlyctis rosea]